MREAAEAQLAETMRFDDSLFVIEEQNLFIDEVRETLAAHGLTLKGEELP